MNKVFLMGRLARDPEVRYSMSKNGEQFAVANFTIAVDRKMQRSTNNEQTADFFNCNSFGKQAEFCEKYLKKGTKILVVGRIENDNYTKNTGEKVYGVKIMVEEIEFAESKGSGQTQQAAAPAQGSQNDGMVGPDDLNLENDLPFK